MDFFSAHQSHLEKYLTKSQILTLQLLIWLLQVQKDVRIERLASCLPVPILYESRRKKIQRLLASSSLSLSLFWFPIIKSIVKQELKPLERLILVLDRTQWQENNVFMISVMWRKRALPIYWLGLEKKGSSNIREQIALIRPVLKLFSHYEVVKLYKKRAGIEAMFRDYKSGGYNLEGSKANIVRLTNLILLIAIA